MAPTLVTAYLTLPQGGDGAPVLPMRGAFASWAGPAMLTP